MNKKVEVSILIPCFKSVSFLESIVEDLVCELNYFKNKLIAAFEIILVVDGSPDGTLQVAINLSKKYKQVKVVELSKNFGQHAAIFAGISQCQYPLIVTMDDDGQHPAKQIGTLIEALDNDTDVVYGVSDVRVQGYLRSYFSRIAKKFLFRFLDVDSANEISAFRLFRRSLLKGTDFQRINIGIVDVLLDWSTSRIKSVPIIMSKRLQGNSNYNCRALFKFGIHMITGYSIRPLRIAAALGISSLIISMSLATMLFLARILGKVEIPGYASLAILIMTFGSLQLLVLGIIGEYIGRIHQRINSKPSFLIRDRN